MNNYIFQNIENRTIFVNDNLNVMQKINDGVIDLIYLDPPFGNMLTWKATNQEKITEIKNYFLKLQKTKKLFTNENFEEIFKNVEFDDTWKETDINKSWQESIIEYNEKLFSFIDSIDFAIKGGKYYLFYMAIRLIEMKRILKDKGSIYLHCDNTMGHYLKNIMDIIFDYNNFISEIIWNYGWGARTIKKWNNKNDSILMYSKSQNNFTFNALEVMEKRKPEVLRRLNTGIKSATMSADKSKNKDKTMALPSNVWYIPTINGMSKERIGYPTQKPLELLNKIIKASSNENDIILDPFCGCATTLIAAESLKRRWIGIDKNKQAFYMNYYRLRTIIKNIKTGETIKDKNTIESFEKYYNEKVKEIDTSEKIIKGVDKISQSIEVESAYLSQLLKTPRENLPILTNKELEREKNKAIKKSKEIDKKYKKYLEEEAKVLKGEKKTEYRENLRRQQNNTCKICKTKLYDAFHLDRIIPGSKGGKYITDNLQILCTNCNLSKNTNTNIYLIEKLFKEKKIDIDVYKININREYEERRINETEKDNLLQEVTKK